VTEIDIELIRTVTNDLIDRLHREGIDRIELEADYYWQIPADVRYDRPDQPRELLMGQLSEDLQFVTELHDGSRPPVTYGFVWIASILRYIGEKIVD
jgi:hypothetical protein